MQLVDRRAYPQLVHVDDLGDAKIRETLTLARIDLHHDAVERRADDGVLARLARILEARLGVSEVELVLRQIVLQRLLRELQTGLLPFDTLRLEAGFHLLLIFWRTPPQP